MPPPAGDAPVQPAPEADRAELTRKERVRRRRRRLRNRRTTRGANADALEVLRAERDALRARLRDLEARRADLVSEALELAATQPRGPELSARIEHLVEALVELDLRAPVPEPVPADGEGPEAADDAPPAPVDAIVLADGPVPQLRRCLDALITRTPALGAVHLIERQGGPSVAEPPRWPRKLADGRVLPESPPRARRARSASPRRSGSARRRSSPCCRAGSSSAAAGPPR